MSTAVKTIAALVFVAVLGAVLTIPLRDNEPLESQRIATAPSAEASPSPTPPPTPTQSGGPLRTKRLVQAYPKDCLRRVTPPEGDGLVAAWRGNGPSVATTDGEFVELEYGPTCADCSSASAYQRPENSVRLTPPLSWSPSGRYLAIGKQGLFWRRTGRMLFHANSEFQHGMVRGPSGRWGWSPISDCGLSIEQQDGQLLVTHIDSSITLFGLELIHKDVESFAYSHDGRRLGLVIKEGKVRSIWIADLARNQMHEIRRFERATCCITLAGWATDQDLLYWAAPGTSVSADGWPLQAISVGGGSPVRISRSILPDPDVVGECASEGTVIAGGNRDRRTNKHVRHIEHSNVRVTPPRLAVSGFTCSPASTIVFSAAPDGADPIQRKLYIIELAGARGLRVLTDDPARADDRPEWATGSGVLFVRWAGDQGRLWFIPEGDTDPRPLPLTVRTDDGAYWAGAEWDRVIDWSATSPDGLPAG